MGIDIGWMIKLDPLARELAVEVIEESIDITFKRDRRLAQMIIEELAQSMSR